MKFNPGRGSANDTDHVFGGALAVGYDFNKQHGAPVRAELEYGAFTRAEGKANVLGGGTVTMKTQAQTLFTNAYLDIPTGTQFTPYVGAGLGMAFLNARADFEAPGSRQSYGSRNNTNFAWNVGAGVACEVVENVALDLGYRFAGLGEAKTKSSGAGGGLSQNDRFEAKNLYMHQLSLGLRFSF